MMIKDPNILLSVINTKLRDTNKNLESLCEDLDENEMEIISVLKEIGYIYCRENNCFIRYKEVKENK